MAKNNRDYIDRMKLLVSGKFESYRQVNTAVTREFFEAPGLRDEIRANMKMLAGMGIPVPGEDKFDDLFTIALRESRLAHTQGMTPSVSLSSKDARKRSWLTPQRIAALKWDDDELITYRARYLGFLKKMGRSRSYIKETKRSSLEILKKMGDPLSQEPFFVRGLVVGSVQSGKTANFNAVINSAIDAGYDLIIVLSGIMEDLRSQTQKRIEKEVEGKYKAGSFIGVGEISSFGSLGAYPDVKQIVVPTSPDTDFSKSIKEADFSLNNKNILICKKNTSVLKNLLLWLHSYLNKNKDKINIPFLIVDDEADNASLNNLGEKGIEYASVINGHIRALLALFNRKTYLGYTATPFGNVLQDRNEAPALKWRIDEKAGGEILTTYFDLEKSLFPDDFIELLFPPPNYVGPKHFFRTRLDEVVKIDPLIAPPVRDYRPSFPERVWKDDARSGQPGTPAFEHTRETRAAAKSDRFPVVLPESLKDAVMCFFVSVAIRISRKPDMIDSAVFQPHNTMLIHISRFTEWQTRTKNLIQDFVDELTRDLDSDLPSDKNSVYGVFERIWYKYYAYVIENISSYLPQGYDDPFLIPKTFEDIKPLLMTAISGVEVKAINSETKDSLEYPDHTEKKYIAVGGNRLSRGFTLEGLTINYFIRNTNFADTLLQMGRWFGYRPGYLDCCKLFSTADSLEKFDQTTYTMEDLEQKFIDMNRDPENTPSKYALLVLKHPGTLRITRPSILKNAKEVNWSFSDQLEQTTWFSLDPVRIKTAWDAFRTHTVKRNNRFTFEKNGYMLISDATTEDVISFLNLPNTFLDDNRKPGENYFADLIAFIRLANQNDKLIDWTIGVKLAGASDTTLDKEETGFVKDIQLTQRSGPDPEKSGRWLNYIRDEHIFRAGGNSANIVTGSNDMAVALTDEEEVKAKKDWRDELYIQLKAENPSWTEDELQKEIRRKNIPEKAFRQKMNHRQGVLMIYLIDTAEVFRHRGRDIEELAAVREHVGTDIPLIGYAMGIPPLGVDIGGTYLQSRHHPEPEPPAPDDDNYDDYKTILE
ncbi:Z1 domain-containing protein [Mucilaginibacter daejeonensis]|uniref:Z1 domain-containing protein n=1 Tax=Mucilaginibacter daejeonensis TaxID=398049 RepID=UPI001D1795A1|nr:Z1 domain-containing protein [Mucilaginibacter daejeonensis]UEG54909.1 Z1 domain-containing protein [Mucilaginibacter daejeonensis]